jgi:hypothetical protein
VGVAVGADVGADVGAAVGAAVGALVQAVISPDDPHVRHLLQGGRKRGATACPALPAHKHTQ